jgi:hypothetical protein
MFEVKRLCFFPKIKKQSIRWFTFTRGLTCGADRYFNDYCNENAPFKN